MTINTRVEDLEQRGPDIRLPSLAESLLVARGGRLGPVSEALTPEIAAARVRAHQGRQEQVIR